MSKIEAVFKSETTKQTMTVTIEDLAPPASGSGSEAPDVEAYQAVSSDTFSLISGSRILTITIAE
ncbi:MAG TPA: hypothetical protein VK468_07690 [Pyrinomonadaceae bacterium]|nr:hypothetical protein [Pyrinomonadaceae bacterium]